MQNEMNFPLCIISCYSFISCFSFKEKHSHCVFILWEFLTFIFSILENFRQFVLCIILYEWRMKIFLRNINKYRRQWHWGKTKGLFLVYKCCTAMYENKNRFKLYILYHCDYEHVVLLHDVIIFDNKISL